MSVLRTPDVAPELVRSVTSSSTLSRHMIHHDDKQVCATSIVIAVSQFISGTCQCNVEGMAGIQKVYEGIVQAAVAGGFQGADILEMYVKRNRWNKSSLDLLEEMVDYAGGPDAVLDALDLANFDHGGEVMQ